MIFFQILFFFHNHVMRYKCVSIVSLHDNKIFLATHKNFTKHTNTYTTTLQRWKLFVREKYINACHSQLTFHDLKQFTFSPLSQNTEHK